MPTLGEAFEKAEGRLKGVIEAGQRGVLTAAAATTAGTDVSGPALVERIGYYVRADLADLSEEMGEWPFPAPDDEYARRRFAQLLSDFLYRRENGAALTWFWVGWEMHKLLARRS